MNNSLDLRYFLVTPLDIEPPNLPPGAQIVRADSLETIQNAQTLKQSIMDFARHKISFAELKRRCV